MNVLFAKEASLSIWSLRKNKEKWDRQSISKIVVFLLSLIGTLAGLIVIIGFLSLASLQALKSHGPKLFLFVRALCGAIIA